MKMRLTELREIINEVITYRNISETKNKPKVKYGPTIENMSIIQEKAHSQKDGIYAFRGLLYRVQNKHFKHYAYEGKVFERLGHFSVEIGKCGISQTEMRKVLKGLSSR